MYQRKPSFGRRKVSGVRSIRRDSYATVKGFTVKNSWWELQKKCRDRAGGRCEAKINGVRCSSPGSDAHHIIALSKGGTNSLSNLIYLCRACHAKRHKHLLRSGYSSATSSRPKLSKGS